MRKIPPLLIRLFTVPPLPALFLSLFLSQKDPGFHTGATILFLTILPLLAYPFSQLIPPLRKKGRKGQRNCAVLFSVLGYIGCLLNCFLNHGTKFDWMVSITYLVSGALIALFTFVFHHPASGHAAGTAGPAFILLLYGGIWGLAILAVPLVYWSSLTLKRHTLSQLLLGSLFPVSTIILLSFLL